MGAIFFIFQTHAVRPYGAIFSRLARNQANSNKYHIIFFFDESDFIWKISVRRTLYVKERWLGYFCHSTKLWNGAKIEGGI